MNPIITLTEADREQLLALHSPHAALALCCLIQCQEHQPDYFTAMRALGTNLTSLLRVLPPVGTEGPESVTLDPAIGDSSESALSELWQAVENAADDAHRATAAEELKTLSLTSVVELFDAMPELVRLKTFVSWMELWNLRHHVTALPFDPNDEPVEPRQGIEMLELSLPDLSAADISRLWQSLEQDAAREGLEFPTQYMVAQTLAHADRWPVDADGEPVAVEF